MKFTYIFENGTINNVDKKGINLILLKKYENIMGRLIGIFEQE